MPNIGPPELFICLLIFFVLYGAAQNGGRKRTLGSNNSSSRDWENDQSANNQNSNSRSGDGSSRIASIDPKISDPYDVLQVRRTATDGEITGAYRKLVQMYHPDKVEGLAPEYREIADKRMKAINAAYEQVKLIRKTQS